MGNKSFLGKGSIYLEEIGGSTGLLPVGNCQELSLAFNEDKKEQKDYEDAGGAVVNTVSRIDSVTGTMTLLELSAANLAKALRALVVTVAAGTAVAAEPHTAHDDAFVAFGKLADKTQPITVTNAGGVTTYTANTDYVVKNNGILIIAGGSIANASAIEISYTTSASYEIEGLIDSGREYKMVFDGLNEADSGNPVLVTAHRVKINPTQALALITDDFGNLPTTFDMLKDPAITGAGLSPFVKIQMVQ